MAIFEGRCNRVFGGTFALQSYPDTLNFFDAILFSGSLIFFMPPRTRGPLLALAHLRTLALPPGLLGPCLLCFLLLSPASCPRRDRRRLALVLAGCPLLPAISGPLRP